MTSARVVTSALLLLAFAACPPARATERPTAHPQADATPGAGGDAAEHTTRAIDAKTSFSWSDGDGGSGRDSGDSAAVSEPPTPSGLPPHRDAEPKDDDPARCRLSLEPPADTCGGLFIKYGAVNGVCRPYIFGGCQGTANMFRTIEECRRVCESRPTTQPCPKGRIAREQCVSCGPNGVCERREIVCAQPCKGRQPCESESLTCTHGFCQFPACE